MLVRYRRATSRAQISRPDCLFGHSHLRTAVEPEFLYYAALCRPHLLQTTPTGGGRGASQAGRCDPTRRTAPPVSDAGRIPDGRPGAGRFRCLRKGGWVPVNAGRAPLSMPGDGHKRGVLDRTHLVSRPQGRGRCSVRSRVVSRRPVTMPCRPRSSSQCLACIAVAHRM